MHYFVSVYFNYTNDPRREQLAKEFVERYPKVIILEVAYGDTPYKINAPFTIKYRYPRFNGFLNNLLINDFARTRDDIESLTVIDCDLILQPYFFETVKLVVEAHGDKPTFIQPFSKAEELSLNPMVKVPPMVSSSRAHHDHQPFTSLLHTGYIYTYNKAAIDLLFPLPECFILGAYDTFLHLALHHNKSAFDELMPKSLKDEMIAFYDKVQKLEFDYMTGTVYHNAHGNKQRRYHGRLGLYDNLTKEQLEYYFKIRDMT